MAMGPVPSCSFGASWGVPMGVAGSILPGPASLFSWSPQVPAFLPGGRDPGVLDVGAAGTSERPGGSGSERSSALGGMVAAGGGAAGPSHLSSSLPGVAVQGVSASGPVSLSGTAVSGISSSGVGDQGSSAQVSTVGSGCSGGRFADASSFMEPGQEGIWEMLRLSVADSTWSHYAAGFRLVATFLAERGWCPGDVAESLLADFVLSSFQAHTSRGVVRSRLAGFSFFCRALGWACPVSGFLVQRMLRAMGRVRPCSRDTRLPITHELLLRLMDALVEVASSPYEICLFQAAFAIAFFGALRVSELLVSPLARLGSRGLLVQHVRLQASMVRLLIVSSKTDQSARGHWVVLHSVAACSSCPVTRMRAFLELRPVGSSALFVHAQGALLTRYQFQAVLRLALSRCGENPTAYGTHSFRIGAATSASMAGMSREGIQRLGRWASDAFRGYIRREGSSCVLNLGRGAS
uniref:Uncharacterized protein LOC117357763 isoform X1 n=1 Tax=Geotrypetes seraphini TaxID=260995 RepID=A0A6P8QFW5_GEOSA|nr:uncharacterized protein LOC117357763 isoform X1 [Geotrypetes seraphini]